MSSLSSYPDNTVGEQTAHPAEPASRKAGFWNGLAIGAVAALIASGVMLWAGNVWGGAILPQLISERMTEILPLAVFRELLTNLEENAKPVSLLGITLTQVILGGLIGAVYGLLAGPSGGARMLGGLVVAVLVWLGLSLGAAPLGGIGLFGRDTAAGFQETQVTFAGAAVVFGAVVALFVPWPQPSASQSLTRRTLLRTAGLAVLSVPAVAAAAYVGRQTERLRNSYTPELAVRTTEGESEFAVPGMPEEITPTEAFYVVSKNLVDPTVDEIDWSLEIGGMVDNPFTMSYTDVQMRQSVDFASTLECVSNPIGGTYISTTIWSGFPLKELLDEAGLQPGVVDIELHAADDYVESIPLDEALAPDTMLVHAMDGEPLDDTHGFPVRLIVPGIYGMKNVKWITGIYAVDKDIQGYWQERGWSDIATVYTMSRIDIPERGYKAQLGETVKIGGVAFAGDRGISRVEVSLDNGDTWQDANLSEPVSELTWRLWLLEYQADTPGVKRLAVRATDGNGDVQTVDISEPLPDGSTGYDRERFEVLDADGKSVEASATPASFQSSLPAQDPEGAR